MAPRFDVRSLFSLSPLDLFSYCAGAGVAAFLARPYIAHAYLPIFAVIGALLFDLCFTRTIANFIGKFGATPSGGLEGTVATPGEAVTNFDSEGKGLIRLTLDGQVVQLLATLEEQRHRRFLVLDEQDCWLRPDLVPRLVKVVHDAGRALGFQVLMISHHDLAAFESYADRIYRLTPTPEGVRAEIWRSRASREDVLS